MNLAVLYYIYVRRKKKRYRKTNNLNHITLLHAFEMCAHCFYSILLNQSSINLSVVIINLCNHLNHSFIENLIIMFNFSNVRRPSFALQMRLNNCDLININYYIPPLCPEFEHEIYLFGVCCKFKECKWSETNNRKTSRHDNKMIPYRESVPLKKSPHIRADVVIKRNGAVNLCTSRPPVPYRRPSPSNFGADLSSLPCFGPAVQCTRGREPSRSLLSPNPFCHD